VIYDQFDPLSSRFRLPKAMTVVMDFIECRLAQQANFRIVANINRIPNIYKNSFMEIQNIFKLKNVKTEKIKTVKRNILLYGGVLLEDRGLEWVSSTIQELKDWEFHIYGFGPELKNLQELGGANTFIFGGISHDELISRASTATAILALYDPMRKNNMFTASNKLFEACQLGIPLIVNRDTHIGEMVEKYGFGHTISYESRCDLVNALKYLEICTEKERETRKRNMTYFFDKQMAITNNERERLTNGILSHVRK
jgi:glycosyltransferase involved in cell wall biosynthesis